LDNSDTQMLNNDRCKLNLLHAPKQKNKENSKQGITLKSKKCLNSVYEENMWNKKKFEL